jgi:DNA-directed RNA polymerase, mitochondrial
MKSLEKLIEVSETGVIEEKDFASADAKEDIDAIKASVAEGEEALPSFDDLDDASLPSMAAEEEMELTQEELEMEEAEKNKQVALAALLNKFVDITEVFPPLPEKGTFDVNDIKKSPYFFS